MPQANSYVCYPDFFIRTPILPFDLIQDLPSSSKTIGGFVADQWINPLIRSAILLASPNLYKLLDEAVQHHKLSDGLIHAFLRYYMRMCFRPTPFGLFAGVGSGVISDKTNIRIKDPSTHILRSRLDMEYLGALVMGMMTNPDLVKQLSFRVNTSLYRIGNTWRYTEVYYADSSIKKYRIVSVDINDVLDEIVSGSGRFKSWADIVKQITSIGYPKDEAEVFVNQLIDTQLLMPVIFPNLTGKEFSLRLKGILEKLNEIGPLPESIVSMLNQVNDEAKPIGFEGLYRKVKSKAEEIGIKYSSSHLIQADLYCSFNIFQISQNLVNKILVGIRILKAISAPRPNQVLIDFKEYFLDRFGSQEIPLSLVMDSDFGLALTGPEGQQMTDPSPLLEGMGFSIASKSRNLDPPHPILLKKYNSIEGSGNKYIEVDRSDIKELAIRKGNWPEQLFALVRLAGSTEKPIVVFDIASSGNPTNIMGRFGFLDQDGRLGRHIEDLIGDDIRSQPECILAEVVHLPEDRTGNILQRPSYYDWEIPFLATPGQEECNIATTDILVSIDGSTILLKDRNSGRRILPRLTNAHNYSVGQLPLYQFLAECVNQDKSPGFFPEWGWLSGQKEFLPGIKFEDVILSQPIWHIRIDRKLQKFKMSDPGIYTKILDWVREHKLPGKVIWIQGDHEMLIDWSNENIVMAAWEGIRRRNTVLFKDYPYESGSQVRRDNFQYSNEVIVSFKKAK